MTSKRRRAPDPYRAFVGGKLALRTERAGLVVSDKDISPALFPFQRDLVRWALATGKAALFAACGLGKTLPATLTGTAGFPRSHPRPAPPTPPIHGARVMSDYNITTTDDDDEHGERYGVQALTVEYDTRTGRAVEDTETEVDPEAEATTIALPDAVPAGAATAASASASKVKVKVPTVRVKVICSCGYYTCRMIRRFGHPEPLYRAEIRPLPSQYARDLRALALHAAAADAAAN